ncbi:MAG: enoyl-CoA hydratase-related protein, partial [Hyphomicrobiales bacterium]
LRLARKISQNAPLATSMVKQVVRNGLDCALTGGLALEAGALEVLFGTRDCAEGLAAFVDKRPPVFQGM